MPAPETWASKAPGWRPLPLASPVVPPLLRTRYSRTIQRDGMRTMSKNRTKQVKSILVMFYLTQYIKNILIFSI